MGTPPAEDGSADLDHVLAAAASIGRHMRDYKVVVDKSTVPVGTADKVRATIAAELHRRGTVLPFAVVSNPEFLKEGAAIEDFMRPDRIVIGADDEQATLLMRALYSPFLRNRDRLLLMDVRSAELTKYVANAMLATRISFMNEMAALAERVAARFGEDLRGHTFALWGLAFKPDTDDMREAPSLAIIDALLSRGARVRAFDPAAMPKAAALMPEARGFELVDNPYAAAAGASALLVVTEWREFRSPDLTALRAALRTPVLFDGRNLYDPELLRSLGFEYHGIGRLGAGAKHERAEPRLQVVAA